MPNRIIVAMAFALSLAPLSAFAEGKTHTVLIEKETAISYKLDGLDVRLGEMPDKAAALHASEPDASLRIVIEIELPLMHALNIRNILTKAGFQHPTVHLLLPQTQKTVEISFGKPADFSEGS